MVRRSFRIDRSPLAYGLAFGLFIVCGCSSSRRGPMHAIAEKPDGVTFSCQRCYDLAVRVLTGAPKHRRYKIVERHACPDCASDAVIYEGPGGKPMIHCEQCAPEGVACDRCLPPMTSDEHIHGSP